MSFDPYAMYFAPSAPNPKGAFGKLTGELARTGQLGALAEFVKALAAIGPDADPEKTFATIRDAAIDAGGDVVESFGKVLALIGKEVQSPSYYHECATRAEARARATATDERRTTASGQARITMGARR